LNRTSAAAAFLAGLIEERPGVAVVLGSGLGDFADGLKTPLVVPYEEIPGFPRPTVAGHAGRLVFGELSGCQVVAMQGRLHLYEGLPVEDITFGVRVFAALEIPVLLLTTASGGVNRRYRPGDIMIIEDQLNFQMRRPGFTKTPEDTGGTLWRRSGPIYSPRLVTLARRVAAHLGIAGVHTGVFAGMLGPTYETPAEVQMTARFGADAISMSTVLEAIAARERGMEVAGVSAIVNPAAGLSAGPLNHEQVLEGARKMQAVLLRYLRALVPELGRAVADPDSGGAA
jgi:purine-nucleoside phosphorylase